MTRASWAFAAIFALHASAEPPDAGAATSLPAVISPACLSPTLDRRASLAVIHSGKVSLQRDVAASYAVDPGSWTVCVDDPNDSGPRRVVALAHGLALVVYVPSASLTRAESSAASWKSLRKAIKDDAQQTGCLKRLPVGTELFDKPGGDRVGVVIDGSIPYGKWDAADTGGVQWAKLKVSTAFTGFPVWIRDTGLDWCPE